MVKYLLGHDLGTSGNKATLYTTEGKLVKSITYNYDTNIKNNNWVEQNPLDWWKAVCVTSKKLVEGIDVINILGVSFSGQMMGCVCVDKDGEVLRNALIWADMRAVEEEEYIRNSIDEREFYEITGHKISCSYGGQKLMWIKNNEPEIYEKTFKMLNAKDYANYKLTGNFATEYTDASSTCLLDLNNLKWSDRLIDVMGLDKSKLPKLLKSTDIVGYITAEAAQLTGLMEGTPVVCGGGDGVCAAVGTGCIKEGIAHSSMGTSSWVSITSKKPIFDPEMKTFTWAHIMPGYVLPTGTMQCGGGSVAWMKKTLCDYESSIAAINDKNVFEIIEEEISKSIVGANGLIFLPYLIGERSPRWNQNAKGGFIGLKMEHEKKDMLRAVQEGVALNLNIILDTFKKYGAKIEEIITIGGGASSKTWMQILSDVYNVKIQKPNYLEEAASMGAVITAGVGIGVFENFDVIDKFLKIDDTHSPIEENVQVYNKLKPIFDDAYVALENTFNKLSEFKLV